jgi:hypothetical protein
MSCRKRCIAKAGVEVFEKLALARVFRHDIEIVWVDESEDVRMMEKPHESNLASSPGRSRISDFSMILTATRSCVFKRSQTFTLHDAPEPMVSPMT